MAGFDPGGRANGPGSGKVLGYCESVALAVLHAGQIADVWNGHLGKSDTSPIGLDQRDDSVNVVHSDGALEVPNDGWKGLVLPLLNGGVEIAHLTGVEARRPPAGELPAKDGFIKGKGSIAILNVDGEMGEGVELPVFGHGAIILCRLPVMIVHYCQQMSLSRHTADQNVMVRFWSLDHHRAEPILWPVSPWPKLAFAEEGTLVLETSSQVHVLPPNRALLLEAGAIHKGRTLGKAKVRTLYFSPQCDFAPVPGIVEVRPLFREMIIEACRIGPLRSSDDRLKALALLLLAEAKAARKTPSSIRMPQSDWLRDWADQFFEDPCLMPPAGFSKRTMERRMLVETGLTLGQWRQQAKALFGLRVMAGGSTVQEAAMSAGFSASSGFIQSFRKQFGVTPGKVKTVASEDWS